LIGENGVDLVGNRPDQRDEEGRGGNPVGLFLHPDKGEFARAVNSYEELEPIVGKTVPRTVFWPSSYLGGLHLGDVDVDRAIVRHWFKNNGEGRSGSS
jgi:hypothetical protein